MTKLDIYQTLLKAAKNDIRYVKKTNRPLLIGNTKKGCVELSVLDINGNLILNTQGLDRKTLFIGNFSCMADYMANNIYVGVL